MSQWLAANIKTNPDRFGWLSRCTPRPREPVNPGRGGGSRRTGSPRAAICAVFISHFKASFQHSCGNIVEPHRPTVHAVNATEIAIYAVETRAIIYVLWGLLLIASISLVGVSVSYVLLRIKLRSARRRESQLARHVATQGADVQRLEGRVAALAGLEEQAGAALAQAQRAQSIRAKSEQRLVEQNEEIARLRGRVAEQDNELRHLRALIEHGTSAKPESARRAA
ncbi:MAG: hypothetical protein ABIO71_04250 [Caldimonas sp.]